MNELNLLLMDMTCEGNTSGVDRYLLNLIHGLQVYKKRIHIYQISLVNGRNSLFLREEETDEVTRILIPLPENSASIITEIYWTDKYNQVVCQMIEPIYRNKKNLLIHIHTLNLIDLALEIKKRTGAPVITHLHCIPWKGIYNIDQQRFNRLYYSYYYAPEKIDKKLYFTHPGEECSYTDADAIIACTQCAGYFLQKMMGIPEQKITVITNGMDDRASGKTENRNKKQIELLFVGAVVAAKGIFYILEALRMIVKDGYSILLHIAGSASHSVVNLIQSRFPDVPVHIMGCVPFDALKAYYEKCQIGIIGSLQEQSSYVAIEMSMFGMPVITTAVDGLDEIFSDRTDALKVSTHFSTAKGLSVDVEEMYQRITELIEHPELALQLSRNIRLLYEKKHTLDTMINQVVRVYEKCMKITLINE